MKRLAKLQASASTFPTPSTPSSSSQAPSPVPSPKPKPKPAPKPAVAPAPAQIPQKRKALISLPPFSYDVWENETIAHVLMVTLDVRPPLPLISCLRSC